MSESKNRNDNSGELDGPSGARARKRQSGVQRVKLSRTKTEAHNMKLNKMTLHAKLTGSQKSQSRHGEIFAAIDVEHLVKPSLYPNTKKTEQDIRFIEETLTDGENFVFEFISHEHRTELIKHMECICVRKDGVIIRQGDEGDYFYIIVSGTVNVHVSQEQQELILAEVQKSSQRMSVSTESENDDVLMASLLTTEPVRKASRKARNNSLFVDCFTSAAAPGMIPPPLIPDDVLTRMSIDDTSSSVDGFEDDASFDVSPEKMQQWKEAKKQWEQKHTCLQKEAPISTLGPGDTFGELSLLYNCPRMASCVASSNASLWRLHVDTFRAVMAGIHGNVAFSRVEALKKVELFSGFDEAVLSRIAHALIPVRFRKGEYVGRKGECQSNFFIIQDGAVLLHNVGEGDAQHTDVKLGPGNCFGEESLSSGAHQRYDITALTDTVTALIMSKEHFEHRLGRLQDLLDTTNLANSLKSIPIFSKSEFWAHEFLDMAKKASVQTFKTKQVIAQAGKPIAPCLYVIRSGAIQITCEKKGTVNTFVSGDYFNDGLLKHNSAEGQLISSATIEVIEDAKVSVLSQEVIMSVVGSISRLGNPLPPISAKLDRNLKLDDLKKERVLGLGAFGKVWLVQCKNTGAIYALKTVYKKQIIRNKLYNHIMMEKNIMASVNHPFIINLITTFQDVRSLYFVTNFIQGGELFSVIHKPNSDGVNNDAARFYAANVIESLSHLHKRNICYRDLKPENVLIDKDGYCILIDMGFAKVVLDKTLTMCGTPEYLSPELVLHKGECKEDITLLLGSFFPSLLHLSKFLSLFTYHAFQDTIEEPMTGPLESWCMKLLLDSLLFIVRELINKVCSEEL
uniref:cGMP-dependent protein kinase n=1 Tax=Ditylum brightwellii TaxID=49249 RepID=A0A7S4RFW5_9STRA|mmetsp:Transcript_25400/g.38039  ORF Transcript_25400/g.38039 Transcript_25400/m.38039 type:complete len:852 (+) Transcript_25400:42-2597(+)